MKNRSYEFYKFIFKKLRQLGNGRFRRHTNFSDNRSYFDSTGERFFRFYNAAQNGQNGDSISNRRRYFVDCNCRKRFVSVV